MRGRVPPFTVQEIKRRERFAFARRFEQRVSTYGPPAKGSQHLSRTPTTANGLQHGKQVDSKWGIIRAFVTPWY